MLRTCIALLPFMQESLEVICVSPVFSYLCFYSGKDLCLIFCSCRNKQANKTQLHEWGSGSEEIISGRLESSWIEKKKIKYFFLQKIQRWYHEKRKMWEKNISYSNSYRRTFHQGRDCLHISSRDNGSPILWLDISLHMINMQFLVMWAGRMETAGTLFP